jgi:uncharacterized Ntn-hydrolase superfamily protein
MAAAVCGAMALAAPSRGTWSICMADCETGEVAVGTVTCLTSFDLLAIVPVVVVGKGSGACQASGDFNGIRRPVIFAGLMDGTSPADILMELEGITGHQSRQYGIVDTNGDAITFTGTAALDWAGGVIGTQGTMAYAIQGNILTGACVVSAIEDAILNTDGDMPAKLMAGMQAARDTGGDGRCSCPGNPTGCGCPVVAAKSGHIGGMIVARVGDTDDPVCSASGCADGDYLMRINVPFQSSGAPDPVDQLEGLFDAWRADLVGRPDAIQSTVAFEPPELPPNGVSTTTMIVTLLDWQQLPITAPIGSLTVEHAADSDGLSTIGAAQDTGGGVFEVTITAGNGPGTDRFVVTADDNIRPVVLAPQPTFVYARLGDIDGDGAVSTADLLALLSAWGPCPPLPESCLADLNGDGVVSTGDLLILLSAWG